MAGKDFIQTDFNRLNGNRWTNRTGKSVYEVAFSDEYLKNCGCIIWGYSEDILDDNGSEAKNIQDFKNGFPDFNPVGHNSGNRVLCKAPVIDVSPQEYGVSWGQSSLQAMMSKMNIIKAVVPDAVFEVTGHNSTVHYANTLQMIDGYSYPEFTISFLLYPPQMNGKFEATVLNLISLMTPRTEDIAAGYLGQPQGYVTPIKFLNTELYNDGWIQGVPRCPNMAGFQFGNRFIVYGLVASGLTLSPSSVLLDEKTPLYMIGNLRMIGGRMFFDEEWAAQWGFVSNTGFVNNIGDGIKGIKLK